MITQELKARLIEICRLIQDDMEADTNRREGLPLTGENVAVALGEVCATLSGLASVVEMLVAEVEPS